MLVGIRKQTTLRTAEKVAVEALIRRLVWAWKLKMPLALLEAVAGGEPLTFVPDREEVGKILAGIRESLHVEVTHGGTGGLRELPLSFNALSPDATAYAVTRGASLVVEVDDDIRKTIRDVIARGQVEGVPPRALARELREVIGLHSQYAAAVARRAGKLRAGGASEELVQRTIHEYGERLLRARTLNIARTETLTAQNMGRFLGWQQAVDAGLLDPGTTWKEWHVTNPCDICRKLQGERVLLNAPFSTGVNMPPQHPSCFPSGTEVMTLATETIGGSLIDRIPVDVLAAVERSYEGPLIEIETALGYKLTGTPNHPVLTDQGWVALGQLKLGDYVVSRRITQPVVGSRATLDHNQQPLLIEDVTRALHDVDTRATVPTSREDFHGDGMEGEVSIVYADRQLGCECEASFVKHVLQQQLIGASVGQSLLVGESALPLLIPAHDTSSRSCVCRFGVSSVVLGRSLSHHDPVCRCSPTNGNVGPLQNSENGASSRPTIRSKEIQLPSDLEGRLPRFVQLDDVVGVRIIESWRGQVYNLQTVDGVYIANNIVVHNCRCTAVLRFEPSAVAKHLPGKHDQKSQGGGSVGLELDRRIAAGEHPSQAAKAMGLERLGGGHSREVYALSNRHVLKVGFGVEGRAGNQTESSVYQSAQAAGTGHLFAPVVSSGRNYLVMERAGKATRQQVDEFHAQLKTAQVKINDLHDANIGVIRGRPVAIDYNQGASLPVSKHLPGKHDQKTHGTGGTLVASPRQDLIGTFAETKLGKSFPSYKFIRDKLSPEAQRFFEDPKARQALTRQALGWAKGDQIAALKQAHEHVGELFAALDLPQSSAGVLLTRSRGKFSAFKNPACYTVVNETATRSAYSRGHQDALTHILIHERIHARSANLGGQTIRIAANPGGSYATHAGYEEGFVESMAQGMTARYVHNASFGGTPYRKYTTLFRGQARNVPEVYRKLYDVSISRQWQAQEELFGLTESSAQGLYAREMETRRG